MIPRIVGGLYGHATFKKRGLVQFDDFLSGHNLLHVASKLDSVFYMMICTFRISNKYTPIKPPDLGVSRVLNKGPLLKTNTCSQKASNVHLSIQNGNQQKPG